MPRPALRVIINPELDRSANTAAPIPPMTGTGPKEVHNLRAEDLVVGAPLVGRPTLTQVHNLRAEDLVVGAPLVERPSLALTEAADMAAAVGNVTTAASSHNQPLGDDMAGPTREEYDAKLKTVAAETDTKLVRLEGKMDLVLSKLDDVREDNRHTRNNQIAIGIGLAILIITIVAGAPTIFDLGTKFRETITKEIHEQMPPSAPRQQP